ncbi:MAG: hypothetical protein WCV63_06355 [Negativicutes bacterium]|jgi:hypothetical protein
MRVNVLAGFFVSMVKLDILAATFWRSLFFFCLCGVQDNYYRVANITVL